jgi:hypothetical protein
MPQALPTKVLQRSWTQTEQALPAQTAHSADVQAWLQSHPQRSESQHTYAAGSPARSSRVPTSLRHGNLHCRRFGCVTAAATEPQAGALITLQKPLVQNPQSPRSQPALHIA